VVNGEDVESRGKEYKNIQTISTIKFILNFNVLIFQTASLLNVAAAQNPWSLKVQFTNPSVMVVLNGMICMDSFFTCSALISFYEINKLYHTQFNRKLGIFRILKLFLYRFFRFAPVLYIIFFFGLYVMPFAHGGSKDTNGNPIWPTFEEVLFWECTEPITMVSKLLMFSNLYPWY
jgi:hypothetical protein